jgi:hypothetical protein
MDLIANKNISTQFHILFWLFTKHKLYENFVSFSIDLVALVSDQLNKN